VVFCLNVTLPLLAALAYYQLNSDNLLEVMTLSNSTITKIGVYCYTLAVITASVPVYAIIIKNNLYLSEMVGKRTSIFLGVILPWIIAWIFNSGVIFASLLNWVSLLMGAFPAYLFPCILYYKAQTCQVAEKNEPGNSLGILPTRLVPYWKPITIFVFLSIALPTLGQILLDFVELVVFHKNVLQ